MCPQCGQQESVIESLRSMGYECRPELGGCGAHFERPPSTAQADIAAVRDAIEAIVDAMREFEAGRESRKSDDDVSSSDPTDTFLERLRHEICRIRKAALP